jgi:hypothetical protein
MIERVTEEMHGSNWVPSLKTAYERALVGMGQNLQRERNGALFGVHGSSTLKK